MDSPHVVGASDSRFFDEPYLPHGAPYKAERLGQQELSIREEHGEVTGPSELPLSRSQILAYGTGHMLNDLTAACWFSYLLIFLTHVGLSPKQAGVVMLAGQVADGIGTLSVGQLIDKFGRFKLWHAGGSLLVAISFSSVFGGCWTCTLPGATSAAAHVYGSSLYAAIFNLGWAGTQVSHMSLVNCITANATSRVALNSCRNAFTMLANLCLYAIAFTIFQTIPSDTVAHVQRQYQWIAGLAIVTGCVFVLIFQLGVGEPRLTHHSDASTTKLKVSPLFWFRKPLYYQVAVVYTLARLATNVSQALLPFFVIDDLKMGQANKAVVPALVYVWSFICSLLLQELNWTSRKLKLVFSGGAVLWVLSGAAFFSIPSTFSFIIYPVSAAVGVANAMILVTATSMEGVLVGKTLSGCAFVYGSLSFVEKLACGIALYMIEGYHGDSPACAVSSNSLNCHRSIVRLVLATLPGICSLVAAVITSAMYLDKADNLEGLQEALLPDARHSEGRSSSRKGLGSAARDVRDVSEVSESDVEENIGLVANSADSSSLWIWLSKCMVGPWGSLRPHLPVFSYSSV